MFALNPNPTFKTEVTIPLPGGKDGKVKFVFKHKGRKALKEFFDSLGEGDTARPDHESLMELIADWDGVDAKFSEEALETLLDNYPGAARAIFEAYNRGLFEGREKN